jgi:hypothetical protein
MAAFIPFGEIPEEDHFAALETPELLVQDIRAFFASLPA